MSRIITFRIVLAVYVALMLIVVTGDAAGSSAPNAALAGRPMAFEDLDGVQGDGADDRVSFDFSADGRYLAVERGQQLLVVDAKSGKTVLDLGQGFLPQFSPNGGLLAFYSTRSGALQIRLWEAKSEKTRQVTALPAGLDIDPAMRIVGHIFEAFRFSWSPDNTRVVFASRVSRPQPHAEGTPLILDNSAPAALVLSDVFAEPGAATGGLAFSADAQTQAYRKPKPGERLVSQLYVVNVHTQKSETLDGGVGHLFHPTWSPDGETIAYGFISDETSISGARSGELRALDSATGAVRSLVGGAGLKYRPRWSWDGKKIAYLCSGFYGDQPVIRVADPRSGEVLQEIKPQFRIGKYDWARNNDGFLLSFRSGGAEELTRLRSGNDEVRPLVSKLSVWWSEAQDSSLAWMDGADVWVLPAGAKKAQRRIRLVLAKEDRLRHAGLKLGRIENITYRTARGFALEGKLLYPPDYNPRRKYPLIVDAYPQTTGSLWTHPISGNHAWAASGYMVFKPHRTRAPHVWTSCLDKTDYCAASKGPEAWDVMVDDVMSGVEELVRRDLIDPQRMCLYGHSNGGGVVDYLITQTDRFKCAVVVAPVFPSWAGAPLLGDWWGTLSDWSGVNPLDDPASYIKLSAVFHVKNVTTPVLLAVGDKDGLFLLGAIEFYQALRFAGKEVTLLRYPGQGHVFEGAGLRDFWQREMAFFAKYLEPSEQD